MMNKKAFSLVELLVALSVLAVVAAIVVPRFLNMRVAAEEVHLKSMENNLNRVYANWKAAGGSVGTNPYTSDILTVLSSSDRTVLNGSDPQKKVVDGPSGMGVPSASIRAGLPPEVTLTANTMSVPVKLTVMKYIVYDKTADKFSIADSPMVVPFDPASLVWSPAMPLMGQSPTTQPKPVVGTTYTEVSPGIYQKVVISSVSGPLMGRWFVSSTFEVGAETKEILDAYQPGAVWH